MNDMQIVVLATAGANEGREELVDVGYIGNASDVLTQIYDLFFDGEASDDWRIVETEGFGELLPEGSPLDKVMELVTLHDQIAKYDDDRWAAYLAWCDAEWDTSDYAFPSEDDFDSAYQGTFQDEAEFAETYTDGIGDIPDYAKPYMDYQQMGRDLMMDFNGYDVPTGVAVFRYV